MRVRLYIANDNIKDRVDIWNKYDIDEKDSGMSGDDENDDDTT